MIRKVEETQTVESDAEAAAYALVALAAARLVRRKEYYNRLTDGMLETLLAAALRKMGDNLE